MKRIVESKEEVIGRENVYFWMNKYIALLEKYNELLLQQSFKDLEYAEPSDLPTRSIQSSSTKRAKHNISNEE